MAAISSTQGTAGRRSQNQGNFTLPNIRGNSDIELQSMERALVPANGAMSEVTEERLKQLETRLIVNEKSSRALLDEIVRLQNTIRAQLRRQEELIRDERQARQQLETTIKSNNNIVLELARRLQTTEEQVHDEKAALSDLISQTKSVELAVRNSQFDGVGRRGDVAGKMRDVQQQIDELQRGKSEIERIAMQMVDEMRTMKARLEAQAVEQTSLASDVRNRNKRLEDEYVKQYESMRRSNDTIPNNDFAMRELRAQIELRISEMRELFVELKSRQDLDTQERKIAEQQLQIKLNELSIANADNRRSHNRTSPGDDIILKQIENAVARERSNLQQQWDIERGHLQTKVGDLVEDLQRRVSERELKVREEYAIKYNELERFVRAEQESRSQYEKDLRYENDRKWDALRKLTEGQTLAFKDATQQDRNRYKEALQKVDEGVNILEQLIEETRKNIEKVLSAEIKSRKAQEREVRTRVDNVEEKLSIATATLQQSLSGLSTQLGSLQDRVKRELITALDDKHVSEMRLITDLDARVQALSNRLVTSEERLEGKVEAASAVLKEAMREKIESISLWQTAINNSIDQLRLLQQQLPNDIYQLQEKIELLKAEINSRVTAETEGRIEDVESVRRMLERLREEMPKFPIASKADVAECNANIKKVTESLQTVKGVLGMKIQSEQNMRIEEIKSVQDELARMRVIVQQLLQPGKKPRVFVKPDYLLLTSSLVASDFYAFSPVGVEHNAPAINRWSLYNTYRWMQWKQKWIYAAWLRGQRKKQAYAAAAGLSTSAPPVEFAASKTGSKATSGKSRQKSGATAAVADATAAATAAEPEPLPSHPWDNSAGRGEGRTSD